MALVLRATDGVAKGCPCTAVSGYWIAWQSLRYLCPAVVAPQPESCAVPGRHWLAGAASKARGSRDLPLLPPPVPLLL